MQLLEKVADALEGPAVALELLPQLGLGERVPVKRASRGSALEALLKPRPVPTGLVVLVDELLELLARCKSLVECLAGVLAHGHELVQGSRRAMSMPSARGLYSRDINR